MDLKINKELIKKNEFFDFLHDKTVGKINIKDNGCIEFNIFNLFDLETKPEYKMIISLGNNSIDFINVYLYKMKKGILKGKKLDFYDLKKMTFQIVDFGYINSNLFVKGSVIKNKKLDRTYVIVEFCFDDSISFVEIKKI